MSKRCLVIPDPQNGPGRPTRHLSWAGHYIADKQPDVLAIIGDWGDFSSMSSYDKGKAVFEGRRLSKDWDSYRTSLDVFMAPWAGIGGYKPRLEYFEGNHEYRIKRAMNDNPELDMLPDVCGYMAEAGWKAHPYLEVTKIDGVLFSHLFPRTLTGRVTNSSLKYGSSSANHMIRANMASCVAGHKPGFDYATVPGPGGKSLHGVIAGSFYLHNETYNGPGNDNFWRGLVMLNGFGGGQFDICPVSVRYLKEKYGST